MITQTPWTERSFDFNFNAGMFPIIIERLRGTLPRLQQLLDNANEATSAFASDQKWSVKQQIGHLYDLEELWYGRIEDFLAKKEVLRAADMTNQKTHSADHNHKALPELISLFRSARETLIRKTENMDEATVLLTALHPRLQKPMRLMDSLFFVAEHDDHHLATIRKLIVDNG